MANLWRLRPSFFSDVWPCHYAPRLLHSRSSRASGHLACNKKPLSERASGNRLADDLCVLVTQPQGGGTGQCLPLKKCFYLPSVTFNVVVEVLTGGATISPVSGSAISLGSPFKNCSRDLSNSAVFSASALRRSHSASAE